MDKLKPTGWYLGRVFNSRLGHACKGHAIVHIRKQPNLKLKTRPKQLLGSLRINLFAPRNYACCQCCFLYDTNSTGCMSHAPNLLFMKPLKFLQAFLNLNCLWIKKFWCQLTLRKNFLKFLFYIWHYLLETKVSLWGSWQLLKTISRCLIYQCPVSTPIDGFSTYSD